MNETPQPPSSEEPKEQPKEQPPIHSSKEAPKSDAQPDEAELQTVRYSSENNPWKPASSPESSSDEPPTQVWSNTSSESQSEPPTQKWSDDSTESQAELPTQVWSDTPAESQAELPTQVWSDASTGDQAEPVTQSWSDASTGDQAELPTQVWSDISTGDQAEPAAQSWSDTSDASATSADGQAELATQSWSDTSTPSKDDEDEGEDDDEDDEDDEDEDTQAGIFIHKGILFAAAGVIVAAAIVVALLLFLNRPIDPPTDWVASVTPPVAAGAPSTGTTLYYLHWTNKNGVLTGQLQLAANNGTPQTLNAPTSGLYSRDNHIIFVIVSVNGQAVTLTGKINDSNDTLTLNQPGAPDLTSQIVFHKGTASDYKKATDKLNAKK